MASEFYLEPLNLPLRLILTILFSCLPQNPVDLTQLESSVIPEESTVGLVDRLEDFETVAEKRRRRRKEENCKSSNYLERILPVSIRSLSKLNWNHSESNMKIGGEEGADGS